MQKTGIVLLLTLVLMACGDRKTPDVSDIKVTLTVHRFEQEFFALDTNNVMPGLLQLSRQYPNFLTDYAQHILGLPPFSDSGTQSQKLVKRFIREYQPVKDSADRLFRNFENIEEEVKKGLQYVKYYFPEYKLPTRLITFIGPMDAYYEASMGGYGDVITQDGLAVGLQLHMGRNYSLYKSEMGQLLYPTYISSRFTPENIPVNCMKNVIDDIYPESLTGKSLVEQMVEKGKRLYVLDKILPHTPDSLKIGYTGRQLKGCLENEGLIWNHFLTNNLLYNNDPGTVKDYVNDGPFTQALGEGSPGFIGLFVGWQIVKKYMEKNSKLTLPQLLKTDARKLFGESKYKPG